MTDESSDTATPAASTASTASTGMVHQAHGGAIRRGDNRPKEPTASDVRTICRKRFFQLVPALNRKARAAKKDADQLRAMELLAKYGMGDTVNLSDVRVAMVGQLEVIRATCPPELADVLIQRIAPLWLRVWAA